MSSRSLASIIRSSRVFQHFLDRRVAVENAAEAVLAQRDHAELDRFLFQQTVGARSLINSRIGSVILINS